MTGNVLIAGTRTAIVSATVTAAGEETYIATTDGRGVYTIDALPGGYNVTATADGYNQQTFSVTVREGKRTKLNFGLLSIVNTGGVLVGTVTDASTGLPLSDATVATSNGDYSVQTDSEGEYSIGVEAGSYSLTAFQDGYQSLTQENISVAAGDITITDFALNELLAGLDITALTATPDSFAEADDDDTTIDTTTVSLSATVVGVPATFSWMQLSGPKVPLTYTDMTTASADVSSLEVAAECELVFELTVADGDGNTASKSVAVQVQPYDMLQYPGANVQIGGSTTAVARFQYLGDEWSLFNIGTALKATPVGTTKGAVYEIILPGSVHDIEIVDYTIDSVEQTYALAAVGSAGVAVVNISDPAAMSLVTVAPVDYEFGPVTFTEGGGAILYDNYVASDAGPVVALATDGVDLYIGDVEYGIHKTALSNVFSYDPLSDETLFIGEGDEVLTVQYAGEHGWGGPISLKLYGGKLFAGLGALGMGIFDPATLEQVGRYNLYTDEARTEDYFGAMKLTETVHSDSEGLFLDDFTGMPDYRQVNYEVGILMHGNLEDDTPWADFERDGKWYYEAVDVDVAEQGTRSIAYIAYSLGGVVAVDVSGFEAATASNFLTAPYLGYFVAVPANGPYDTGSQPASLLPYEGAGMLKESGVISVDVLGDRLFLTDHFAGLVILSDARTPESWGMPGDYDNDTDGIPDNNVPEFEDVTSYDMSPWDESDNESLPWAYYQAPSELATRELNGHAYGLALMNDINLEAFGQVDVLECSTGGGFVFVDVDIGAANMEDRFEIMVEFPTTNEIGAAPDGSPTETIALGHTDGIAATDNYIYVSDGPHGITAWKITDDAGYPADEIHVVANTIQDEYPVIDEVSGELIYPASHTVRNVIDPGGQFTWALSVGNGLRRVPISDVEEGLGVVGEPLLMKLYVEDSYEHNGDLGVVDEFNYQDQAYDVEFIGNYAYVADGTNGLTVYDTSKVPNPLASTGFFVGNIGYNQGRPLLGTASGIELWTDPDSGKRYAVLACGPNGVGVVDITDVNNLQIVKVFEPIKYEDEDLGSADGQAIDVEVVGDNAYFGYDSFGLIAYSMSDLIEPVPAGVNPTQLFKKKNNGTVFYDYRPEYLGKFKLQEVEGWEDIDGGSVKMAYTQQGDDLFFYTAFGHYGVVKIDYSNPELPVLVDAVPTASECVDVEIANGRLYVGDHAGGLVLFK